MYNSLIGKDDPRIADLLRKLGKIDELLRELEVPTRRTLNGHRFLTDNELSEKLRVSRRTLQEYRSHGVLPYYLICGKILYSENEIQQYLEKSWRQSIEERELL